MNRLDLAVARMRARLWHKDYALSDLRAAWARVPGPEAYEDDYSAAETREQRRLEAEFQLQKCLTNQELKTLANRD